LTVGSVTRIWSVRNFRSPLKRYWVGFHEDVFIHGETPEQSGVLSICPPEDSAAITAHLRVFGREVTQVLQPGEDISVRIHGLELIVGVRAVEDDRLLLEFGIPEGSHASLTLAEQ
jgi:hypothetical protein